MNNNTGDKNSENTVRENSGTTVNNGVNNSAGDTTHPPLPPRLKNRHALKTSWKIFALNPWKFILVGFLSLVIMFLAYGTLELAAAKDLGGVFTTSQLESARTVLQVLLIIVGAYALVFTHTVYRGFIVVTYKKKTVKVSQFFSANKRVFLSIVTTFLQGIVTVAPIALFSFLAYLGKDNDITVLVCSVAALSLGFVLAVFTSFAPLYTIDEGAAPHKAIGYSCVDVARETSYVLVSIALGVAIILASSLAFGVPLLAGLPFVMIYRSIVYRNITAYRKKEQEEAINKIVSEHSPNPYLRNQNTEDQADKDFRDILHSKKTNPYNDTM